MNNIDNNSQNYETSKDLGICNGEKEDNDIIKQSDTSTQQPSNSDKNEVDNKDVIGCLGCLIGLLIVGGLIWLEVLRWKIIIEYVNQAEQGSFIGDNPVLYIILCIIGGIVSIIIFFSLISKK